MLSDLRDPRFPIGPFEWPAEVPAADRAAFIARIAAAPAHLRDAVAGLSDAQLDTPYREGGWTVRQVIHHLPDSHMNAFIRFKLGLTGSSQLVREAVRWVETSKPGPTQGQAVGRN